MESAIVTAELSHIDTISEMIRDADRDELMALYGRSPKDVLTESFAISKLAWSGMVDGVPICMFGVVDAGNRIGRPWMIGTTLLERHQIVFLRNCSDCVQAMVLCFERLENYVDARNKMAITWLKWLKFTMGDPEPMGLMGLPFIKFHMEA